MKIWSVEKNGPGSAQMGWKSHSQTTQNGCQVSVSFYTQGNNMNDMFLLLRNNFNTKNDMAMSISNNCAFSSEKIQYKVGGRILILKNEY